MVEPDTDDCLIWCGSEETWPFAGEAKSRPRGHTPQWMGWGGGRLLMDVLAERVISLGVDVRFDRRVLALVADDDNNVHGVVVHHNGEVRFARAPGSDSVCRRFRDESAND